VRDVVAAIICQAAFPYAIRRTIGRCTLKLGAALLGAVPSSRIVLSAKAAVTVWAGSAEGLADLDA